jgi:hypothetical protein
MSATSQENTTSNKSYTLNVFTCECSWGGGCSKDGTGHAANLIPFKIHASTKKEAKKSLFASLRNVLISFLKNDGYLKRSPNMVKIFDFEYTWDGYESIGDVKIVADVGELASGDIYFIRYVDFIKELLNLAFDPDDSCVSIRYPPNPDGSVSFNFDEIDAEHLFNHHLQFMESVEFDEIEPYFTTTQIG